MLATAMFVASLTTSSSIRPSQRRGRCYQEEGYRARPTLDATVSGACKSKRFCKRAEGQQILIDYAEIAANATVATDAELPASGRRATEDVALAVLLRRGGEVHERGWPQVVRVCRDEAVSVPPTRWTGPASPAPWPREAPEADAVVVARLDRLARSLTIQEAILAAICYDGGHVFAGDQGEILRDDPTTCSMRPCARWRVSSPSSTAR